MSRDKMGTDTIFSFAKLFKKMVSVPIFFTFLLLPFAFICAQEQKSIKKIKRDPFVPLVTPDGRLLQLKSEDQEEELVIEGIMYDNTGLSYALVNGEVARIGDRVGEYQVLKIQEHSVIFVKEGQTKEVEFSREAGSRPAEK